MTRELIEATVTTHGPITFTSREIGRLADTDDYILNTALYYALGLATSSYVEALRGTPSYDEDTADVVDEVYVTPAAPIPPAEQKHVSVGTITTIRNARTDQYVEPNPDPDSNVPTFEKQRSLTQENHFRFYVVPRAAMRAADTDEKDTVVAELLDQLPRYFRLGAGRGKVRARYRRLRADRAEGSYTLGHPVSYHDVSDRPTGNAVIKDMQPVPLVVQGEYDGPHLRIPATAGPPAAGVPEDETTLKRHGTGDSNAVTDGEVRVDPDWQERAAPSGTTVPGPDNGSNRGSVDTFAYPATAKFLSEKR